MVIRLGYIGQDRRRSTPEERAQYVRDAGPSPNGRKPWKALGWAVMTALAVAAALTGSARAIAEGAFFWSLHQRVPALEQRVDIVEKTNRDQLQRIIDLLEEQKKERKP